MPPRKLPPFVSPQGRALRPRRPAPSPSPRGEAKAAILAWLELHGPATAIEVARALYPQFCGDGSTKLMVGWALGHMTALVKLGRLVKGPLPVGWKPGQPGPQYRVPPHSPPPPSFDLTTDPGESQD